MEPGRMERRRILAGYDIERQLVAPIKTLHRGSPTMRRLIPVLLLHCLASAIPVTAPVPLDANGKAPALTRSSTMPDGSWLVADTAGRVWWSGDRGAKWEEIPSAQLGSVPEIFSGRVMSMDEKFVWSKVAGWLPTTIPPACQGGSDWTMSGSGFMGVNKPDSGVARYCRSVDGLLTWTYWFGVAETDFPPEEGMEIGDYWNGRIWYSIVDSSYIRGTSDGRNWTRISIPQQFRYFRFSSMTPEGSDLELYGSTTKTGTMYAATTVDSGRNWQVHPMSEPGHIVHKITDRLFYSMTNSDDEGKSYWLSRALTGPWVAIAKPNQGMLYAHDSAYVVTETSITLFDFGGAGVAAGDRGGEVVAHRVAGGFSVRLPDAVGSDWDLVSLDGRILASGRAMTESVSVPRVGVPAMLRIAGRSVRLPPF